MSTDKQQDSPSSLAGEMGRRLRAHRLNANLTQADLAELAGVNRNTVINAENGRVHLESFIAILQALGQADQLDLMLPEPAISPVQLMKLKGKQRQRASGRIETTGTEEGEKW